MMKPTQWFDCYESGWKGLITPAAFAHPAKFSRSLIERIFAHCLERGYLKKGDAVGDCFGGIGTGGIAAAYAGLKWRGCELEPRFVKMAEENFKLHQPAWLMMKLPWPYMIQGDSRKFDVVPDVGSVQAFVASPPYAGLSGEGGGGINVNGYEPADPKNRNTNPDLVGERTYQGRGAERSAGNIETLKEGTVQAVISSPPYSDIAAGAGGLNTKPAKKPGQCSGRNPASASQTVNWSKELMHYGTTDGQIAKLKPGDVDAVVASPPYADSTRGNDTDGIDWNKAKPTKPTSGNHQAPGKSVSGDYGATEGQIGALKVGPVEAVVTSPPWEDETHGGCPGSRLKAPPTSGKGHSASLAARERQAQKDEGRVYGDSVGQIGVTSGETYWQAVDAVYRACFRTIKPGGVIVLVVKDYVKAKKRVPLCDDTARLLEHIGFSVIERIHAMLVKETTHDDLFPGQSTVEKKERKSFFRRLAEKKGSPKIDFEEVIIARRP